MNKHTQASKLSHTPTHPNLIIFLVIKDFTLIVGERSCAEKYSSDPAALLCLVSTELHLFRGRYFIRGDKATHGWLLAGVKWNNMRPLDWHVSRDTSELREAVGTAEW